MLTGFINKGLINPSDVRVYDKNPAVAKRFNVACEFSAFEVVEKSEVVFLCVKPQNIDDVLDEIKDIAGSRLIVSIAAGVSTRKIESRLKEARVVRVMPNTPALIHEVAAAYCLGELAQEEDAMFVGSLFNSIGVAYRVEEAMIDAVTGLSGSGPAYAYYVIKALTEAGVKEGLDEGVALNLTLQTVRGAVDMVIATKRSPDELIEEVKSPGGTTVEGLRVLDERKVHKAFVDAVRAATKRSRELGK
jgi:pyrroline-5-carboxylate reductase